MGDTTAVIALSHNAPLTIITSHGSGEHRHRIVVGEASRIGEVVDLAGKRIGVKKGTSTYGGFLAFLAYHHLTPEELQIIDMRPAEMPEALAAGSVDAFVASEPTPSLAELQGARELATLGGLGNTYPILILVRNSLLEQDPENLRRFMRALRNAEMFVRDHPEQAAAIIAEATGLPADVVRRAMQRHTYAVNLDYAVLASLRQTAEFLRTEGIIRQAPKFENTTTVEHLQPASIKTTQTRHP
jgi:ABC-type nitrate/sulfonate/bicarbonate transport system substrate-binding protein